MKEYKVNLNNKEYIIKKDEDGLFIMPPELKQFEGFNINLKPSIEPICVARKPLSEKTVAENVLKWGTGGINIDGCRVEYENTPNPATNPKYRKNNGYKQPEKGQESNGAVNFISSKNEINDLGRWPANFIHDGSEEVVSLFPESNATNRKNIVIRKEDSTSFGGKVGQEFTRNEYGDKGSASRFFYCAKASKKDRNEGLDGFELKLQAGAEFRPNHMEKALNGEDGNPFGRYKPVANNHPTVKPTDLMAYLCRLVTPKNGLVLDPFNGSGSTGKACAREGFNYIGIDLSQEYLDISKARIEFELNK